MCECVSMTWVIGMWSIIFFLVALIIILDDRPDGELRARLKQKHEIKELKAKIEQLEKRGNE